MPLSSCLTRCVIESVRSPNRPPISYFLTAPRPPSVQLRHRPAPLWLPDMNWHRFVSFAISPTVFRLNVPRSIGLNLNCVSVTPYVIGLVLNACSLVAQAAPPGARLLSANGNAALHVEDVNGPA